MTAVCIKEHPAVGKWSVKIDIFLDNDYLKFSLRSELPTLTLTNSFFEFKLSRKRGGVI